jgi:hypothetical protein
MKLVINWKITCRYTLNLTFSLCVLLSMRKEESNNLKYHVQHSPTIYPAMTTLVAAKSCKPHSMTTSSVSLVFNTVPITQWALDIGVYE